MTARSRLLCLLIAVLAAGGCTAGSGQAAMTVTEPVTVVPSSTTTTTTAVASDAGPSTPPSSPSAGTAGSGPSTPPTTTRSPTGSSSSPSSSVTRQAFVTAADLAAAKQAVAGMTPAERAGAVIMASSSDALGGDEVARLHLGGVILMGSNGIVDGTRQGTPDEVAAVTAQLQDQNRAKAPLLIGTDQEYGDVTRLQHGFTAFPGASELAAISDTGTATALTEKIASAAASELLAVGVNIDFAPDADVLPDSGNSSIGDRSYGADPERTAQFVAAAVRGYQRAGLPATLKHFPGIGSLSADTHEVLPTLDESCAEWNERDRDPMAAGVKAGVALVMTGHVRIPAAGDGSRPASVDKAIVTDLLRGTKNSDNGCQGIGFTGVTVTDSLQMLPIANTYDSGQAAVAALQAGQDLLLMPVDPAKAAAGITAAVRSGALPEQRLVDAAVRVYALRLAVARTERPAMSVVGSQAHQALAEQARADLG